VLIQGHSQGEFWGLAVNPSKEFVAATAGDDKTLRLWDLSTDQMISMRNLEHGCRALHYSPDGRFIVAGLNNGAFAVYDAETLVQVVRKKHRKQRIQTVRFSPNGFFCAVGSHDNYIDVYSVNKATGKVLRRVGVCKGHSNFVTALDWSADSRHLRSTSGSFELLFWDALDGESVTGESVKNVAWSTSNCPLGWDVAGVWPAYTDGTDIKSVDCSASGRALLVADDFGGLSLHAYPCESPAAGHTRYAGHSARVTNAFFTTGDQYVISAGGADKCLMLWRHADPYALEDDSDPEDHYDSECEEDADEYGTKLAVQAVPGAYGVEMDGVDDLDTFGGSVAAITAAKPWFGSVHLPSNPPESHDGQPPEKEIALEWVHGCRAHDTRGAVAYTGEGKVAYVAASVGVVYDTTSHSQQHFCIHKSDIVSFTMSADGKLAATGEASSVPVICIWDTNTMEVKLRLRGFHRRAVRSLGFSPDSKYLVSIGQDLHHSCAVYNVETGALVSSCPTSKNTMFAACIAENKDVVVGGKRYIAFSTQEELCTKGLKQATGLGCARSTFLCALFIKEKAVVGTSHGSIFEFTGGLPTNSVDGHDGPVNSISSAGEGFVTGGKDGLVITWGADLTIQNTFDLNDVAVAPECWEPRRVRSVFYQEETLLIGAYQSEILELDCGSGHAEVLVQGHGLGEVWALAMHPSARVGVTSSDDMTVRLWDLDQHKMLKMARLQEKGRAVAFSPDGLKIVVGCVTGQLFVFDAETLAEISSVKLKSDEWISDVKFCPLGQKIAVACHDNYVHVLDASTYEIVGKCKGHASYVTHLDWSASGTYLRSTSGAYELLFWQPESGSCKSVAAELLKDETWHTCTCDLGWDVCGVWPMFTDGANINSVEKSHDSSLLVSADDKGRVNLFKYPAVSRSSQPKSQTAHSSHVTAARFSADDTSLLSVGGNDMCVMQWKLS